MNEKSSAPTADQLDKDLDSASIIATLEDLLAVDRPRRDLRPTDSIANDINLDSLGLLEVLTRIEDAYNIELLDAPETYSATTVAELAAVIAEKAKGVAVKAEES